MHHLIGWVLLVVAMLICLAGAFALFVHAVRADRSARDGWIVIVPLLIIAGWLVEVLIMG